MTSWRGGRRVEVAILGPMTCRAAVLGCMSLSLRWAICQRHSPFPIGTPSTVIPWVETIWKGVDHYSHLDVAARNGALRDFDMKSILSEYIFDKWSEARRTIALASPMAEVASSNAITIPFRPEMWRSISISIVLSAPWVRKREGWTRVVQLQCG